MKKLRIIKEAIVLEFAKALSEVVGLAYGVTRKTPTLVLYFDVFRRGQAQRSVPDVAGALDVTACSSALLDREEEWQVVPTFSDQTQSRLPCEEEDSPTLGISYCGTGRMRAHEAVHLKRNHQQTGARRLGNTSRPKKFTKGSSGGAECKLKPIFSAQNEESLWDVIYRLSRKRKPRGYLTSQAEL
ncbi:hypothetical protein EVAR_101073_1 [Eumeta japonica]|uniref:Uncharacterized protein n=1 Tax=Eumeta variegata TaxID=151549 RepID=A0A4C1SHS2_EUMVA|nr:hypothetical protein EVAR_101073_1 [Eumeta japonica]